MITRKTIQYLGLLISLLAAVWFVTQLVGNLDVFRALSFRHTPSLLIAILVYSATPILSNLAWHKLLLSVGANKTNLVQTIAIGFVSQFAKYLPGNFIHHLTRVVLAKECGHKVTDLLVTVFLETFWVICAATIIAVAAVFAVEGELLTSTQQVPRWWVLLIVLSATAIAPYIAQRLVRILLNWWMKYRHIETTAIAMPSLRTFSFVCALYVLNFFLLGIVIFILAGLLSDHEGVGVFTLTGIFAVAWVAGFITPGAPAGLGIRELILVTSLSPFFGGESAVGIAATLRAVTILGDGLVFIEGGILYRLNFDPRKTNS